MKFIQNQVMKIISSMQEIVQVITSLFECVQRENIDIISDIKDLREETNDLINFWFKGRYFNFRKKKLKSMHRLQLTEYTYSLILLFNMNMEMS